MGHEEEAGFALDSAQEPVALLPWPPTITDWNLSQALRLFCRPHKWSIAGAPLSSLTPEWEWGAYSMEAVCLGPTLWGRLDLKLLTGLGSLGLGLGLTPGHPAVHCCS